MLPFFKIEAIKEIDDFFLLAEEKKEFLKFKIPKRKIEWLSSRFIAKKLISEKFNCEFSNIQIYNDSDRKPFAIVNNKKFRISISHRENLCGCAFNSNLSPFIGIDIEKIEEKDKTWIEEFFDQDEILNKDLSGLIELWSLKEALLKMLGLGLSIDIREIKIKNAKIIFSENIMSLFKGISFQDLKYKIYKRNNYIISLAWIGEE